MNRGGAVEAMPAKTPLKDGGNPVELGRATKSGRKVKRPAHFDDSPDAKKTGNSVVAASLEEFSPKRKEAPEAVKKSARKTIFKSQEDSPKSNGEPEVEVSKKSARKTLAKQESREEEPDQPQKSSRRTLIVACKEDSPEPEAVKKSARKTLLKSTVKESREEEPEQPPKSSRRTMVVACKEDSPEPEQPPKSSRRTMIVASKEDSPEPETVKKSARKTLLKSAVKKSSLEQDTPKKDKTEADFVKKAVEKIEPEEETPAGPGVSRTGRKIKVPAHLKEFEDVLVVNPKKEATEKLASRKSLAPVIKKEETEEKFVAKTPGRGRSLAAPRKAAEPELEETKALAKTPRRGKSLAADKMDEDDDHLPLPPNPVVKSPKKIKQQAKSPAKAEKPTVEPVKDADLPAKTRGKSLAPGQIKAPVKEEELPAKTPRRGKSLAPEPTKSPVKEEEFPVKTPRRGKSLAPEPTKSPVKEEELPAKMPRQGKSLAPEPRKSPVKEEKLPAKTPSKRGKSMAAPVGAASPGAAPKTPKVTKLVEDSAEPMSRSGRKIKPKKYFGEFEQDETVPVVAKVASPVKMVAKSSPMTKKESPPKKASPVKRHQVVEKADESPKKKAKLEPKTRDEPKKVDDISPNTEERQITKRGVNDHHRNQVKEIPLPEEKSTEQTSEEVVIKEESGPVEEKHTEEEKPKRERKTLPAASVETQQVPEKPVDEKPTEQQEKPKRGRKTLPAPSDDGEEATPKTPVARRMAIALVATEDVGSSRSGRKIKPKKFFGEDEEVSVSKSKATAYTAPANEAGRGRRKTLAAELDKESEEVKEDKTEEVKEVPKAEVEQCPSREEILAVVGAVDLVKETEEEEKLEEELTANAKHDDEPTPMEEDDQPEPVVVGTLRETVDDDIPQEEADASEPIVESVPMSTDDDVPAEERVEEDQIESVEPETEETNQETDPVEDEESALQESEAVESALEENFQETPIPQTSPPPCPTTEEVPNDPAPLPEEPPLVKQSEPEEVPTTTEVTEDLHDVPEPEQIPEEPEPSVDVPEEENTSKDPEPSVDVSEEPALSEDVPEKPVPSDDVAEEEYVPKDPEPSVGVHEEPELPVDVPEESELPIDVPEETELPVDVPEETELSEDVPEKTELSVDVPEEPVLSKDVPVEEIAPEEPTTNEEQTDPISVAEANQPAAVSASSSFSEALLVDDESVEQHAAMGNAGKEQQYESVEFLETSGASTAANEQPIGEIPLECTNVQEPQQKEDELDNTEAPPMDDIDEEKEEELLENVPEPTDGSFAERDRDNESIIVIPDTPKPPKSEIDEDFELSEKIPDPHSSQTTVARVELHYAPVVRKEMLPASPRTPESKVIKTTTCSPDKPEDQEQANVPLEIIEIPDSPITMLKADLMDNKPGSATSTPLKMGSKTTTKDRLIQNSRKRSLSASDADNAKKNVTFHSPANSTILVDTLDERLKKKNESATKPPQGHRKRSLSEHKDPRQGPSDGAKPAKISKLPNFKNIHQKQFNRMESIEEFHNRKIQRAREILADSASKSPAATALVKSERSPFQKSFPPKSPHKSGNGTSSSNNASNATSKSAIGRPMIPKPSASHKPLSDAERLEKRQKQFQAAFKPKTDSGSTAAGTGNDTPDGARRVIEQSRHKQNQIIKGVRTNKRFDLLMKFRDAQD